MEEMLKLYLEEYLCVQDPAYCNSEIGNITGIISSINEEEVAESGLKVYPNPSNGQSTISFYLTKESDVQIQLTDMSGRLISNITDKRMSAGKNFHQVDFKSESVTAGVYFVNLRINGNVQVQKLILE